jgi:S-methylmethionine-dependent homocysteine/selenocysteine methylase
MTSSPLLRSPFTVIDGGLSTALEEAGHSLTDALWTARFLADDPQAIVDAHRAYLRAGADVLITSSYQASVAGFVAAGHSADAARHLIASSTDLARRAVAAHATEVHLTAASMPLVAASVGPFGATLHDGSEYHGRYAASWSEVRRFHAERLAILAESGPDLLAVETLPSVAEAEIVVEALAEHPDLTAWITFSCRDAATTCHGEPIEVAAAAIVSSDQVVAVGVNCTAPEHVAALLRSVSAAVPEGFPLVAYPNHGRAWDAASGCWLGPDGGIDVHDHVQQWLAAGARLIGGCCGVGPAGIAELAASR